MCPLSGGLLCMAMPASDQPTFHTGAVDLFTGREHDLVAVCWQAAAGPWALLPSYPLCLMRRSSCHPGHTPHLAAGNEWAS